MPRSWRLDALEAFDAALLGVKPDRNPVEYCWTATPAVCLYVLAADPAIERITYLDADLRFFSDPAPSSPRSATRRPRSFLTATLLSIVTPRR